MWPAGLTYGVGTGVHHLTSPQDGFDAGKRNIVIGATNRRTDLDPALLSRFDTSVLFPLPDEAARCGPQVLALL